MSHVCDSCLDAAYDEAGSLFDDEDGTPAEEICLTLGADIADHLCDEIETQGEVRCDCACKQRRKRELRAAA